MIPTYKQIFSLAVCIYDVQARPIGWPEPHHDTWASAPRSWANMFAPDCLGSDHMEEAASMLLDLDSLMGCPRWRGDVTVAIQRRHEEAKKKDGRVDPVAKLYELPSKARILETGIC